MLVPDWLASITKLSLDALAAALMLLRDLLTTYAMEMTNI
jgi:hypothetical protein